MQAAEQKRDWKPVNVQYLNISAISKHQNSMNNSVYQLNNSHRNAVST